MAFSRRSALRRMALTSPRRRAGARLTVSYTAAWSAIPSRKSWHSPSWRIRRISRSSLPFRRESITWSSQVWLRSTPKTRACTRCLSAVESAAREHSRSTRVSAKERPSCQRIRQVRAVWREVGGIVLHRGTLHAERSSFNLQKQAAEKGRFSGVVPAFACLFWGFPLPSCKWPGAFPTGLSLFPPDCAFPPGRC